MREKGKRRSRGREGRTGKEDKREGKKKRRGSGMELEQDDREVKEGR